MVKTLEELEAKLASAVDSSKYWARAMTDAKANLTEARAEANLAEANLAEANWGEAMTDAEANWTEVWVEANLVEANLTEARTTVDSLEAQIVKLKEQAGG